VAEQKNASVHRQEVSARHPSGDLILAQPRLSERVQ
jgi:hypothetical protein